MGRDSYEPSFSILQRAELLGNKKIKPVNRRDRFLIDNLNLETQWTIKKVRENIVSKARAIRQVLDLPTLNTSRDLRSKSTAFITKDFYVGVNSSYLKKNPDIALKIERAIYTNVLVPMRWSYNFYPFIEYLVLYERRVRESIKPNPKVLELILHKHKELGRNKYTKSDKDYIKQQVRILVGATDARSTRKMMRKVEAISSLLDACSSDERPPRNSVLRILCFNMFNTLSKDRNAYLEPEEKQYHQYLKLMVKELIVVHSRFYKNEIRGHFVKKLTRGEAYSALLRYHHEYLKITQHL